MTLQDRLTALATAVGTDIKALVNQLKATDYLASYNLLETQTGWGDASTTGRPDDDYYLFSSTETTDPEHLSPSNLLYVHTLVGLYSPTKIWRRYKVGAFTSPWLQISGSAVRASIRKNTVTNLANATETSIAFNVDEEDDWGFHTGSDIWMIVPIGFAGMYFASFECWYGSNTVNARYTRFYRDRGGVVTNFASDIRQGSPGGVSTIVHLAEPIDLLVGDKVWPSMYQNAGAGVTLQAAADTCRLKLVRFGNI